MWENRTETLLFIISPGAQLWRHPPAGDRGADLQGVPGQPQREEQVHQVHLQPAQLEQRLSPLRGRRDFNHALHRPHSRQGRSIVLHRPGEPLET